MSISRRSLLSCAISSVLGISSIAGAQESARVTLEEIVVTAQKRSESLQDVPVAVSAFSDETRDLIGITTVQDFTNFTPGITYNVALDRMFVRGVGRYTNNLATSPGIATYGDGFYNSSNHQADATPLFIERVEVLRGPQGTLSAGDSVRTQFDRRSDERHFQTADRHFPR
jgi:iron complex outermembrane recepter protein